MSGDRELALWRGNGGRRRAGDTSSAATAATRGRRRDLDGVVLLLSVEEAAMALGLGRTKTYELIARRDIEVVHIDRCARVPLDSVEAYVARLRGLVT